ncbi:LacI family DNA-binding transcriptional regulator [Mesobacterium pallidum]|uniref:LacI family DNA-binding transcriptional regulator n=1 Tax=Mesobacterium pallidum TaxID=2872037 RepID=UPI001EE3326B|nr:LacI family DNA-binding transcriptional regulator [Mesobacterium pallidum]
MPTKTTAHRPPTRPRKRRVTIADVANELGVTKGLVSRALNDYPDISEATRERVRAAAEAMGYRALSHARAIRTGQVRALGLVIQLSDHDGQRPFLADLLSGISQAASAADWTVTIATSTSDADTLHQLGHLADAHKADGFILPRTYEHDARIDYLRAEGLPFVLYGRTADDTGCAWYDVDSGAAMAEAVALLAGLGHRVIGFVPGATGTMYDRLRREGFAAGMRAAHLDTAPVSDPACDRAQGAAAARALLGRDLPPTAILCATDAAAVGVYDAARAAGLSIGTDLSVIGYDGLPEGAVLDPPLSTFHVDAARAGARLTDLLIRSIAGEDPADLRDLDPATFRPGGSHGAPTLTPAELAARVAHSNHVSNPGRER